MKKEYTKIIVPTVAIVFGLIVLIVLATEIVPERLITLIKASQSNKPSLINSYVLGDKMLALADGKDYCVVNVFLLDDKKRPVSGVRVDLRGLERIENIGSHASDNDGKMSFRMTSDKEGQFDIEAVVNGVPLTRSVKVTFRN